MYINIAVNYYFPLLYIKLYLSLIDKSAYIIYINYYSTIPKSQSNITE